MMLVLAATLVPGIHAAQTEPLNPYGPPDVGHGLNAAEAADGWLSLFDGKTAFGWSGATVDGGVLTGGAFRSALRDFDLKADVAAGGTLSAGGKRVAVTKGMRMLAVAADHPQHLRLDDGLAVRSLAIRPTKLRALFNGKDLAGWKRIDRASIPKDKQPTWTIADGTLRAVGGPGALEHETMFGDGILQVEVKMNRRHTNGGLFFRAIPGDFMNGYEAQLHNRAVADDPAQPAKWATGGIDDRMNARRLVSRDGSYFVMTVAATGPHLATWVNGYQTVDWTDPRPPHTNPRQGKRTEPGVIQLQAHDPATDLTWRKIAVQ